MIGTGNLLRRSGLEMHVLIVYLLQAFDEDLWVGIDDFLGQPSQLLSMHLFIYLRVTLNIERQCDWLGFENLTKGEFSTFF